MENMSGEEYFYDLLAKTKNAFQKAPIKEFQETNDKSWYYAVCDSPIIKGSGVIFGLNWGASQNRVHNAQTEYPFNPEKARNWNFASTSKQYFQNHLGIDHIGHVNYSNLCFFRSKSARQLQEKDWELSLPLFEEYLIYIQPKWCILLGTSGIDILEKYNKLSDLTTVIYTGTAKRTYGYKGKLFNKFNFFAVPHPQARVSRNARQFVWQELFRIP